MSGSIKTRNRVLGAIGAICGLLAGIPIGPAAAEPISWDNPAGGNWHDAVNWDPQNVPNAGGEHAFFPAGDGAFTTYLNGSVTLDSVTVANTDAILSLDNGVNLNTYQTYGLNNSGTVTLTGAAANISCDVTNSVGGRLTLPSGATLHIYSNNVTNDGTIWINSDQSDADAVLSVSTYNQNLTGSGEIILQTNGDVADARLDHYYGHLIQGADHTIRGEGTIGTQMVDNLGTIVADVAGRVLLLNNGTKTNNGTYMATSGGTLQISTGAITQGSEGLILADGGTVEFLESANITGGTFDTASGGVVRSVGTTNLTSMTNLGDYDILGGVMVYMSGAEIVNEGTIQINSDGTDSDAVLQVVTYNQNLTGSGEIVLQTNGDVADARLGHYYGHLIQGAGHTIRGEGTISAQMIDNFGTIVADVAGRVLLLNSGAKTNNGVYRATNGGTLRISGDAITQGAGGLILADGGTVDLTGSSTISGGMLDTANGGVIQSTGQTNLTDITNLGEYEILEGVPVYLSGGGSVNDGTITINPDQGEANAVLYITSYDLSLEGSGQIVLETSGTDGADASLNSYYGSLRQGVNHSIRGEGSVNVNIPDNQGTIAADVDGRRLYLADQPKTNNGTIKATGNGILQISSGQVTQGTGGLILADGGTVELANPADVRGGTLNTADGGVIQAVGSTKVWDVSNLGYFEILGGVPVYFYGTDIVNDGTITINPDHVDANGVIYFSSYYLNLTGSGEIVLETNGALDDARIDSYYGDLTQGASHTIRGEGTINVLIRDNRGLIAADAEGRTLQLKEQPKTNNGVFKGTNGGTLLIGSGAITQGEEGRIVGDGGTVALNGANITGGKLDTVNGGAVLSSGTTYLADVTNEGEFGILNGVPVYAHGGALTNNGTITINSDLGDGNAVLYVSSYGLHLAGSGDVVLQTNGEGADANINSYYGSLIQDGGHTIRGEGTVNAGLTNNGTVLADVPGRILWLSTESKTNNGGMRAEGGVLRSEAYLLNNGIVAASDSGVVRCANMTGNFSGGTLTGGTWEVADSSTVRLIGANISTNNATIVLDGPDCGFYSDDGTTDALAGLTTIGPEGHLEIRNGHGRETPGDLSDQGSMTIGDGSWLLVDGRYSRNSATDRVSRTLVNGTLFSPDTAFVERGILGGTGLVATHLVNNARLQPGASTGTLTIDGDYVQSEAGWMTLEFGGTGEGEFDRLAITGTAALAGTLYVVPIDGFEAAEADSFEVMTFAERTGDFDKVYACPGPGVCVELVYTDTSLILVAHALNEADVEEPEGSLDGETPGEDEDVEDPAGTLPSEIRLASYQAMTGEVVLALDLPQRAAVELGIFDITGRRVATLVEGEMAAGSHSYRWSGKSGTGRRLSSGVYFGRALIRSEGVAVVRRARVLLIR